MTDRRPDPNDHIALSRVTDAEIRAIGSEAVVLQLDFFDRRVNGEPEMQRKSFVVLPAVADHIAARLTDAADQVRRAAGHKADK